MNDTILGTRRNFAIEAMRIEVPSMQYNLGVTRK